MLFVESKWYRVFNTTHLPNYWTTQNILYIAEWTRIFGWNNQTYRKFLWKITRTQKYFNKQYKGNENTPITTIVVCSKAARFYAMILSSVCEISIFKIHRTIMNHSVMIYRNLESNRRKICFHMFCVFLRVSYIFTWFHVFSRVFAGRLHKKDKCFYRWYFAAGVYGYHF